MKKKAVLAAVIMLTIASTAFVAYAGSSLLLRPIGRIRVALRSINGGSAKWFPTEPRVYDGSFSAALYTGGTANVDGGEILIGPLSWPLSMFTDARITFWAYHRNDPSAHPYINIILDNGRVLEGLTSTPVSAGATVISETGQGYPSADIWIQMKPYGGWYTSFPADPVHVAAGTSACTLTSTCPLAFWQSKFPTARVIQVEIVYGIWALGINGGTGQYIYIDNVLLLGMGVPIEPETIAAD